MTTLRPDVVSLSALLLLLAPAGPALAQAGASLQGSTAPANAVWVDSLDLSRTVGGRQPRPGLAAFGGRPARGNTPAVPDAQITLGGTLYSHGFSVTANSERWIDLDGTATRFVANAGIDDVRKSGRGSVSFEV